MRCNSSIEAPKDICISRECCQAVYERVTLLAMIRVLLADDGLPLDVYLYALLLLLLMSFNFLT